MKIFKVTILDLMAFQDYKMTTKRNLIVLNFLGFCLIVIYQFDLSYMTAKKTIFTNSYNKRENNIYNVTSNKLNNKSKVFEIGLDDHINHGNKNKSNAYTEPPVQSIVLEPLKNKSNTYAEPAVQSIVMEPLKKCVLDFHCNSKQVDFNISLNENVTIEDIVNQNGDITMGGSWKPKSCKSDQETKLIFAYRDRHRHLMFTLNNLIPFLKKQKQAFRIFVVEQLGKSIFNKAILMNVAFTEVMKMFPDSTCFIFHDVDTVPIHLCNFYKCDMKNPRHLMVSRTGKNKPPKYAYRDFFGGAFATSPDTLKKANGFTNLLFGWGVEDDLMQMRFKKRYRMLRYSPAIGNYHSLSHDRDAGNPYFGFKKWGNMLIMNYDGLNSLDSVDYQLQGIKEESLFTRILVDIKIPVYNHNQAESYFTNETNRIKQLHKIKRR